MFYTVKLTEKNVYCENIFEGGHIGFFQRGKPMHGFESKLESFSVMFDVLRDLTFLKSFLKK